jgi:hypothetical protein
MHSTAPRGRRRLALAGALVLAITACRTGSGTRSAEGGGEDGSSDGTVHSKQVTLRDGPRRRAGVGHPATIDRITLSADGSAALTRDGLGGTRLWPTLDGSVEPVLIPLRSPQAFSLARTTSGWNAFIVDASGGAKSFALGSDGKITTIGELPPFKPLFEGHVLPGGKHVLALYRDHTLRLLTIGGEEIAKLEARKFRPNELRIANDGRRAVAVIEDHSGGGTKVEIQPLLITTEGKPSIRVDGSPRLLSTTVDVNSATAALSPDGRRFAIVDKWNGSAWDIVIVELGNENPEARFAIASQAHMAPGVGFVSPMRALAAANDGSVGWLIDLESKSLHARNTPPQDFTQQLRVQAFARDRHVAAHGNWLYVSDVAKGDSVYIGYRTMTASSIAVSPSATHVATYYPQGPVYVEPLDAGPGESARIPVDPMVGIFRVRFLDDKHVITVDGFGGVQLLEWRTGEKIAETGVNGSVRSMQVDAKRGMLLIDRHSMMNDSRIFEVDLEKGFRGPYIVADQSYRTGLLRSGPKDHAEAVLWTLDSGNKMRWYTLSELRSDLSAAEIKNKGIDLKQGQIAPLAIDRMGRSFGVRWNGTKMELFVDYGGHMRSKAIVDGSVSEIIPAEDGEMFVAVLQRSSGNAIAVFRSDTLDENWSFSSGVFHSDIGWSPDGRYVAVAAQTGAVVREADSGEAVLQRCGLEFEALGTPPTTALQTINQRTICEP